jgi:hypothetical protein
MLGKTTNTLLQQTEQQTQSKVPAKFKTSFDRVVLAGQKLMYSDETHSMMRSQLDAPNPPEINVGEGIAKLMGILWKEGKGTIQMEAFIPAALILLCEGMDFAEKAGKMQVTPDTLAAATKELMSSLMQILGITPEKIQAAKAQAKPAQPAAPKGIIGKAMGA